ncbi:putative methyltransferase-domain-containing protein [Dunaliella salina]|uniref:Methyltransferase-domain-containing protein n=1 Tax=Dunaliella salina TaxID=3046 RepID=A0ABQ7H3Q5_DUNSA|nr:putative methyltransferase-domain-containing protein [Dunaliella salina]|eukprot:KAF5841465.1 putative methyltransferase-domain-containing protein [Dunaliella salina]
MVVWQSGFVLAELLLRRPPLGPWPGVKVLELGAGTGITGIALALAGARVMLTDLPHILPLTQENVATNCRPIHAAMVAEHRWGSDAAPLLQLCGGYPDIIVAADCIYETQFHGALMSTLQQCMGSHSQAFFSYRNRTAKEQSFSGIAAAHGFVVEAVPSEQLAEDYQSGGYCVLRLARIDGVPEQASAALATHSPWAAPSSVQHCSGRHGAGETRLNLGVPENGEVPHDIEDEEEEPEHKPCSQS